MCSEEEYKELNESDVTEDFTIDESFDIICTNAVFGGNDFSYIIENYLDMVEQIGPEKAEEIFLNKKAELS